MVSGGGRAAVSAINLEAAFIKLPPYPPASNLPQRSEIPRKYPENIYIYMLPEVLYILQKGQGTKKRTKKDRTNKKDRTKIRTEREKNQTIHRLTHYPQASCDRPNSPIQVSVSS